MFLTSFNYSGRWSIRKPYLFLEINLEISIIMGYPKIDKKTCLIFFNQQKSKQKLGGVDIRK